MAPSATKIQFEIYKALQDAITVLAEFRRGFPIFLQYFGGIMVSVSDTPHGCHIIDSSYQI